MPELTTNQKTAIRSAVVAAAAARLGVREDGPPYDNRGTDVDQYLAFVGSPPGNPWCAAFACYCLHLAGALAPIGTVKPTGYCPSLADHARGLGVLMSAGDVIAGRALVKPGDLMLMWEADLAGYHHAGIVERVPAAGGWFGTIEGNTNTDGGREGYEVARQIRNVHSLANNGERPRYAFVSII